MDIAHAFMESNALLSPATPARLSTAVREATPPSDYAVLLVDVQGQIQFNSPSAPHLLNVMEATLVGMPIASIIPALPLQANAASPNLVYLSSWSQCGDWEKLQANGIALEVRLNCLEFAGQRLVMVELRSTEVHHEQQLQRLIQASEQSDEIVMITDTAGEIEYVNPVFERISGYSAEEVIGNKLDILNWELHPSVYAQMWATLERVGSHFFGVFTNRKKNGRLYYEERHVRAFINIQGMTTHYICSGRDVSDRERLIQRLEHLANHDSLTGLPNRNLFMDRLRQAQAHAARHDGGFSLLLLDLDHFKAVNDQFGHAAGDAVLIAVASRLSSCVRNEDTVARLGGDEFAILLASEITRKAALKVLDKIAQALSIPIEFDHVQIRASASIGAALRPFDTMSTSTLLNFADSAMYRVKATGGNGYHLHHPGAGHTTNAAEHGSLRFGRKLFARYTAANPRLITTTPKEN
jgi:diguanylate cyclase (GGDEF)-like protein/PAS domain S-box-containing protein